jgi:hypothetical protein
MSAGSLALGVSAVAAAPSPKPTSEQQRKGLESMWADLLSTDEYVASRAALRFAAFGGAAVTFTAEHLRSLRLSKQLLDELLRDLGRGDAKRVENAYRTFAYLDPRLAMTKQELCDALLNPDLNRVLAAVLCDLPIDAFAEGEWHWYSPDNQVFCFTCGKIINRLAAITVANIGKRDRKATWVRATRAVAVLEFLDTPQSRAVLDDLATGHPDAVPTKAAKLARDRGK